MNLDNLFDIDQIREISAVDGGPSIMTVRSNGTMTADSVLEKLFVNDKVRMIRAEWTVWDITGDTITLIRLEN